MPKKIVKKKKKKSKAPSNADQPRSRAGQFIAKPKPRNLEVNPFRPKVSAVDKKKMGFN